MRRSQSARRSAATSRKMGIGKEWRPSWRVVTRKTCKRPSESLREASGNISFYMAKMKKWESLKSGWWMIPCAEDSSKSVLEFTGSPWFTTISQLGSFTLPSPDARSPRPTGRWGDLVRSGKMTVTVTAVTQHMEQIGADS